MIPHIIYKHKKNIKNSLQCIDKNIHRNYNIFQTKHDSETVMVFSFSVNFVKGCQFHGTVYICWIATLNYSCGELKTDYGSNTIESIKGLC